MTRGVDGREDDFEQTQPAEVLREVWSIICAVCGEDSFNGIVPSFSTRADMWTALEGRHFGWTRRDDGRVLCRSHSRVADCDRDGHVVSRWEAHPIEAGLQWRYCGRCGAQFDQRIRPPRPS